MTLYELATLHHPAGDATDVQLLIDRRRYASKPLRHWNRHIPVDFQTIVLKAIAEFPARTLCDGAEIRRRPQSLSRGSADPGQPAERCLAGRQVGRGGIAA